MNHVIRRFRPADRDAMLAFAAGLPEHDLLFLGRDLRQPRVIAAWLEAIEAGWIDSFLAADADGVIIGSAALVRDPHGWSAHVGEVRLLVMADRRGHGLGRDLVEAVFAAATAHGLAKLTASMTVDQAGSRTLLESVGFHQEALLAGHVRDQSGTAHDLAILACPIGG